MSQPIPFCLISKAAHGDEQARNRLMQAMKYNIECGHYSIWPCRCVPPCPEPTAEMMSALNEHLAETAKREEWWRMYHGR